MQGGKLSASHPLYPPLQDSAGAEAEAGLSGEVRAALQLLREEQAALDAELAQRYTLPQEERQALGKVRGGGGGACCVDGSVWTVSNRHADHSLPPPSPLRS